MTRNPETAESGSRPALHRTSIGLISTLALMLLFIVASEPAQTIGISPSLTSAVDVRGGPGSFYPMVVRLLPSATFQIIDRSEGWVKIESDEIIGWIPSLALGTRGDVSGDAAGQDRHQSLRDRFDAAFESGREPSAAQVSEAQVVAAVKGFVENHIRASREDLSDLSGHFEYRYNPDAYLQFRSTRVSSRDLIRSQRRHRLSYNNIPLPDPQSDMVGWAAGNKIAQIGVYNDPRLRDYLNHVAMLVTESSHRPDLHITVVVLDTDDIAGYAVPGGLIFITRGAIRMMRTEAEFAAFIGHEISHIVFQHGQTELDKRSTRIRADDATRRMDQYILEAGMADERYIQITRELQQTADQLFEYLIADRLHEYEFEADYYGMIYASRAGYRGEALYNVIERISLFHRDPESDRKSAWYGDTLHNRLDALKRELSRNPMRHGNHFSAEWDAQTRHLRNTR